MNLNRSGALLLIYLGLWVLLILAVLGLRRRSTQYNVTIGSVAPAASSIPTEQIKSLFAPGSISAHPSFTNETSLFFTRHFMPPVVREGPRRVELTYRGYYEVAPGPRRALIMVGNSLSNCVAGNSVVADLVLSEVFANRAVLTNSSGRTNELRLNKRESLVIPAQ